MKNFKPRLLALTLGIGGLFLAKCALAANPIIMDQFTADPTGRVFEGRMYLYASHDIPASPGRGRGGWFVMEDYHVFSSENLIDWTDHGVLINQTNVPWLQRASYDMWAPDCVTKNGKYYFYFPAGGRIGIATADKPYGPFTPEKQPITGANGIDPCVLQDTDGSAYLVWKAGGFSIAKLKDNMLELDSPAQQLAGFPQSGLIEGPFIFKRNDLYYLSYPHVADKTERLEYAMATNPMGPYKVTGVVMDESPSGCWTDQDSITEYKGQWYLFYHDNQLSPNFDKNRSVRIDYLHFNDDGTIQKVIPTLRGVGIADAKSKLQIDRYSDISSQGVAASYLNTNNPFGGWKISLNGRNTWVKFDRVDFGSGDVKSVKVRSQSETGGMVEIRVDKVDGPVLARVKIENGATWKEVDAAVTGAPLGVHDLVVTHDEDDHVDIDWVSFE